MPIATNIQPFNYIISVRSLCALTAKTGDLDLRFTPSPTALEGIFGHAMVTARRGLDYQREISLSGEHKTIFVRGRADGYDPASNQLEEIKTYKGDLQRMPDNYRQLHWAQAKIYAWLLCQEKELPEITVALVYYNITTREEILIPQLFSAESLRIHFEFLCEKLLLWAEQEVAHRSARDQALATVEFPHPTFRNGQRQLAEATYKTAALGRCLMAQATTGIGKTLGTLFPLLKAMPGQKLDKIFFLTAKTSGRQLGLDALKAIKTRNTGLSLRVLELTAREKACEHPDKSCHGESCPLAKGFYDRLPQARQEALSQGMMDKAALRETALKHQVCPYYMAQDLANWSDVVVGDYNYYFDLYALLYAGTALNEWRVSLLVDEAHNMIERARKMYSAELDYAAFMSMCTAAPKSLKSALNKLNRIWQNLAGNQEKPYQVYEEIPERFQFALQQLVTKITDYLAENPTGADAQLLGFYFDALQFTTLADAFGEHSLFDVTINPSIGYDLINGQPGSTLCIRNVVPAAFLKNRFALAQSSILFSATLSPSHFYSDMLGLPTGTAFIDVASPFKADQLNVNIASHISTRYRQRGSSLAPIAKLMAEQYQRQPGNYILFLSSFEYLQKMRDLFTARYPGIPTREQIRGMGEAERELFINRFTSTSTGIAFAVLGGSFGEGIDLPGERLIGAFIATLGLPQINDINEQMRERMDTIFGAGYDYTYLYPGLQKVVQAAGRVIRTQDDRGTLYLIDDRFDTDEVIRLLPSWWQVTKSLPKPH